MLAWHPLATGEIISKFMQFSLTCNFVLKSRLFLRCTRLPPFPLDWDKHWTLPTAGWVALWFSGGGGGGGGGVDTNILKKACCFVNFQGRDWTSGHQHGTCRTSLVFASLAFHLHVGCPVDPVLLLNSWFSLRLFPYSVLYSTVNIHV